MKNICRKWLGNNAKLILTRRTRKSSAVHGLSRHLISVSPSPRNWVSLPPNSISLQTFNLNQSFIDGEPLVHLQRLTASEVARGSCGAYSRAPDSSKTKPDSSGAIVRTSRSAVAAGIPSQSPAALTALTGGYRAAVSPEPTSHRPEFRLSAHCTRGDPFGCGSPVATFGA